ncbi:RagB/SusD family nutrient uptake outer membrane protein [Flammeovirga kamogawensis]|uniref:RagB/SusD family nutrient uptake outer membrane protein n=1 Tax=Flammeovirga kamogawensis TaxID=373891 RepID=A0ABX8GYC7_9BACT|nr:RagB/SusD family nutrient uptake outer membrane protein [Flammeovirga kamogawensis]MBB6459049.1 hypothetical protein [Flammeovirga kamogawensis]QWG08619.1 RagB/SusD family nutrient uptake outer membrane protein [Flammeovirga kamogawensis]TRX66912.1 RagB/SusD family nutrient uptake outer membrane protein [Flammeovirga kamogawensis]
MKTLAKYIIASALLSGTVGCSDFLNNPPQGVQTVDNFYQNEKEATQGLMASYYWLSGDDWYYKDFFRYVGDVCSDDAFDGYSDQLDFSLLSKFDITPQNEWLEQEWNYSYKGIYHANIVIDRVPNAPFDDQEIKDQIVSEAKVLRAYQYFGLVRNFGGVIIMDAESREEDAEKPRSTEAETWAFIESDLLAAIPHLPTRSAQGSDELGRITKGTAQALLAKVYLYQSKWTESLAQSREVMKGGYSLESSLSTLWDGTTRNSLESIFEIQTSNDMSFALGASFPTVSGSRSSQNGNVNGWGFDTPSSNLDIAFGSDDPRKGFTMIKHMDKLDGDGNPDATGTPYYAFADNENDGSNASGRINRKMFLKSSARTGQYYNDPYQYKIIRYADVLLMAAEAAYHTGDQSSAKNYVNQVRQRAIDNAAAGHGMALINSSGAQLLSDIYKERRLELAMEGERFYDLKRTGRMTQVIGDFVDYNMNSNTDYDAGNNKGSLWNESKHIVFPIPQTQIDLSNGAVKQNPGY